MPLSAPESFELESEAKNPLIHHRRSYSRSNVSDDDYIDDDDDDAPYTDNDTSQTKYPEKWPTRYSSKSLPWLDPKQTRTRWYHRLIPSRFACALILLFTISLLLLLTIGGLFLPKVTSSPDSTSFISSPPYYPTPRGGTLASWKDAYSKAAQLVSQMTLPEKVNLTTGTGWRMGPCVGNTAPIPRLSFPSLCLQDGPLGLRFIPNTTAWPAPLTLAATWSKTLLYQRAQAQGFEAKKKGVNIVLGPAMGPLGRLPAGGRGWEGFGPDPVLQAVGAGQTVRGLRNAGVMAVGKHFVGNEQEHFRQAGWERVPRGGEAISSNIDDRTLHELYAWPFAEAVRAGVAGVMCAYNQVNNSYACQNSKLLNGVLKEELGFQGFVVSDWLAHRSGVASALAGLDMSMPGDGLYWEDGNSLWGTELTKAVLNTSVPMERLNDMALRIVAAWYKAGQDMESEWPPVSEGGGPNFSSWTDDEVGLLYPGSPRSEERGVVNKNVPVRQTAEDGNHDTLARQIAAEGTVLVKNEGGVLPLKRDLAGWEHKGEKVKVGIFGEDAFPNPDGINACEDRGCNVGTLTMGWGSGAVELPYLVPPVFALDSNFDSDSVSVEFWADNKDAGVAAAAAEQDLCFVFINADAGEGFISWEDVRGDRNDLYAQKGGDELVRRVAQNCENTIVVLHTVGPTILEKWIELPGVKAVLIAHLPGQEAGNALVDVVFGDVNPSGRLPYTIAKAEEDYGPTSKVMYTPNDPITPQQDFSEGLYVDYRYFDKHDITPRYEFGYGLSYTSFKLNSLMVHPLGLTGEEPRPPPEALDPPDLDTSLPIPESALWPSGMRRLTKYIYPYISHVSDITKGPYDYPEGYHTPQPRSNAGGGEGGNPDLYRTAVTIRASLTNLTPNPGFCVVQLYLTFPPNLATLSGAPIDMPVRVLRNFDKVWVGGSEGGEKRKEVSLDLTRRDLSFWDVERQDWVMPRGEFKVQLGFSSRDLPLDGTFESALLNFGGGGKE